MALNFFMYYKLHNVVRRYKPNGQVQTGIYSTHYEAAYVNNADNLDVEFFHIGLEAMEKAVIHGHLIYKVTENGKRISLHSGGVVHEP